MKRERKINQQSKVRRYVSGFCNQHTEECFGVYWMGANHIHIFMYTTAYMYCMYMHMTVHTG